VSTVELWIKIYNHKYRCLDLGGGLIVFVVYDDRNLQFQVWRKWCIAISVLVL